MVRSISRSASIWRSVLVSIFWLTPPIRSQSLRYQLKDTAVEVLELAPPYVQTEMMGPGNAVDPRAMPLQEFIAEVMHILATKPAASEILVERVMPLRNAEANGGYGAFFKQFNDGFAAH